MKELLDKISEYNIFNYLFPGIIFCVFVTRVTKYDLRQEDIISGAFFYYFIGMVVSRFGSLIIEPILKKIKFIEFADYKRYIEASKKDEKIELLGTYNNMYRTIIATIILISLTKGYSYLQDLFLISEIVTNLTLFISLLLLFLFSYRKQTNYIVQRIDHNNSSTP